MKRRDTVTPETQTFYRSHHVSLLGQGGRPGATGKNDLVTSAPKLTYTQAMRAWFVYQGQAYNVELCQHRTFTAFIESVTPPSWSQGKREEYIVLAAYPEDSRLLSRWYTLEMFSALKVKGLVLFGSKQEAIATSRS